MKWYLKSLKVFRPLCVSGFPVFLRQLMFWEFLKPPVYIKKELLEWAGIGYLLYQCEKIILRQTILIEIPTMSLDINKQIKSISMTSSNLVTKRCNSWNFHLWNLAPFQDHLMSSPVSDSFYVRRLKFWNALQYAGLLELLCTNQ